MIDQISERMADYEVAHALRTLYDRIKEGEVTSADDAKKEIRRLGDASYLPLTDTGNGFGTGDAQIDYELGKVFELLPHIDAGLPAVEVRWKIRELLMHRAVMGPTWVGKKVRAIEAQVDQHDLTLEQFGLSKEGLQDIHRTALIKTGRAMLKGIRASKKAGKIGMEKLENYLRKNGIAMEDLTSNGDA